MTEFKRITNEISTSSLIESELKKIFAGVVWPCPDVPEPKMTLESMGETLEHLYRSSDEVKKFYLPKIMSFVLTEAASSVRDRWLYLLVEFLDVDFYEETPNSEANLKAVKVTEFSFYTKEQARAILQWLNFVKKNFCRDDFKEELDSAIRYWKQRAEMNSRTSQ